MLRLDKIKGCCSARPQGNSRELASIMSWFLPSALLLMVPKCPLCIVAYIGIVSGIGISVSTATGLRILLVSGCLCLLVYALVRALHRLRSVTVWPRAITGGKRFAKW